MNKADLQRLTQLYRAAQGQPTKMTPEQIKEAEKKLSAKR